MDEKNIEIYKEFGKRIAQIRDENGLSQKELADKLGIAQSTLAGYEKGVRKVPLDTIKELSQALNVPADFLIHGKTSNKNTRDQVLLEKYHEADDGIRTSVDILLKMSE